MLNPPFRIARLATALLLPIGASQIAHADTHFERTLPVHGTVSLTVETGSGSIHISESHDSVVHVSAVVRPNRGWFSSSESEAAAREVAAHPPIEQNGNSIHLGKTNDPLEKKVSIEYTIAMPHDAALSLHTGSGDVDVASVGTSIQAGSGSGSLRIHGTQGPATLRTGSGDIDLQGGGAGDMRADTGSGSIRLHGIHGSLQAQTGSGDIEIEGSLSGDSTLRTGSGSVRLNLPPDSHLSLDASTGSGRVRVGQQFGVTTGDNHHSLSAQIHGGGPRLRIQTGSGDVDLR